MDGGTLPGSSLWYDLCVYMKKITKEDNRNVPSFLDKIRAKWITNSAHGLRIAGEDRTAANKYRCEFATVWNTENRDQHFTSTAQESGETSSQFDVVKIRETVAAAEAQQNIDILRDRAAADDILQRTNHSHLEYYENTNITLRKIFEPAVLKRRVQSSLTKNSARELLQYEEKTMNIEKILAGLKADTTNLQSYDNSDDAILPIHWRSTIKLPQGKKMSDQLNSSQKNIWVEATEYLKEVKEYREGKRYKPNPIYLLVHGGPGTGKTFLAQCIYEEAHDLHLGMACMAPTGIAASGEPEGRTIHNLALVPIYRKTHMYLPKLNALQLATLQERIQHQTLALLYIDEISFVSPELLAQVDHRAREIMGNNEPFGGLGVIITGDFDQIPPIPPAESLVTALLKVSSTKTNLKLNAGSTTPSVQGACLFASFRKIELSQQMRAMNDPLHMDFLEKLRSTTTNPKLKLTEILERIKVITKEDVERDPSWMIAPVVVTSNEERFRINEERSRIFSMKNNYPRIIWYQPIVGIVANGLDQGQINYLYATCPRFKGIFVYGVPGFLKMNINPKRGLTNGTPITLHSLILDPREKRKKLMAAILKGRTEDIVLKYNPKYVLVKITNANPEDYKQLTVVQGQAIIPLAQTHICKPFKINVPGKNKKVDLQTTTYGIDLGFSITMHKIQGQTCSKLIIDLNYRPFQPRITFSAFYVAVSRVRRSEDLRRMPNQPGTKDLNYLTALKPQKQLVTWLKGYNEEGYWDSRLIENDNQFNKTKSEKKSTNYQQLIPNGKKKKIK